MSFSFHDIFFDAFACYWPAGTESLRRLPLIRPEFPTFEPLPPETTLVHLPNWASDCGVSGKVIIPRHLSSHARNWEEIDWPLIGFWYLHSLAERAFEKKYGSIHSYSFRLKGWDERLWEHAWANRIALFMRRWAARTLQQDEEALFGPLPDPKIVITHDVDAVAKTMPIRLKQCTFNAFNAVRFLTAGKPSGAAAKIGQAVRFLFSNDDWWMLDELAAMETRAGIHSHFNFYADTRKKNLTRWLFDPGYDITSDQIAVFIRAAHAQGFTIGLHTSFDSWCDAGQIRAQKEKLEDVLGNKVQSCRQHWLRFSWKNTWQAQQEAGLELDSTLGFNDRSGFRNGCAIKFHPIDPETGRQLNLSALPLVLMDSHLYDYAHFDDEQRTVEIKRWIDEIRFVRGTASILWHPQTLGKDYGWRTGFEALLKVLH